MQQHWKVQVLIAPPLNLGYHFSLCLSVLVRLASLLLWVWALDKTSRLSLWKRSLALTPQTFQILWGSYTPEGFSHPCPLSIDGFLLSSSNPIWVQFLELTPLDITKVLEGMEVFILEMIKKNCT